MGDALWNVLAELAPWLLLGAIIAGLLHVTVPQELLRRQLRGKKGVFRAVGVGVPLPLCSCGVIPVALGLKQHGASDGAVVAFLISTPQTGVDSILVTAAMLGWPLALFKVAAAFATGAIGGLLTEALVPSAPAGLTIVDAHRSPQPRGLAAATAYALDMIRSIWRWLVLGILVSAALAYYVPQNSVTQWSGGGRLAAMFAMLALSVPLYVCAVASVPMAAALVAGGMPTGAALVFLMAGPATNAATIGAVYRTLGRRALAIYLSTIVVGSILLGWAFEAWSPWQSRTSAGHDHSAPSWIAVACAWILLALLGWFAVQDVRRWLRRASARRSAVGAASSAVEMGVEGMTCANCTTRLERALVKEAGVDSAEVQLHPGRVVVRGEISPERVREIVVREGFRPASLAGAS